jgi:hypothetical protein
LVLQRSDDLLQVRFEYRLNLGIMRAPMTIRADSNDRNWRIWSPIREALDVMHFQIWLEFNRQKRRRRATSFTLPASPSEGVELDPTRCAVRISTLRSTAPGNYPGITQSLLAQSFYGELRSLCHVHVACILGIVRRIGAQGGEFKVDDLAWLPPLPPLADLP